MLQVAINKIAHTKEEEEEQQTRVYFRFGFQHMLPAPIPRQPLSLAHAQVSPAGLCISLPCDISLRRSFTDGPVCTSLSLSLTHTHTLYIQIAIISRIQYIIALICSHVVSQVQRLLSCCISTLLLPRIGRRTLRDPFNTSDL